LTRFWSAVVALALAGCASNPPPVIPAPMPVHEYHQHHHRRYLDPSPDDLSFVDRALERAQRRLDEVNGQR